MPKMSLFFTWLFPCNIITGHTANHEKFGNRVLQLYSHTKQDNRLVQTPKPNWLKYGTRLFYFTSPSLISFFHCHGWVVATRAWARLQGTIEWSTRVTDVRTLKACSWLVRGMFLRCRYVAHGTSIGHLNVYVGDNNAYNSSTPILTISGDQGIEWQKAYVNVTMTTSFKVRVYVIRHCRNVWNSQTSIGKKFLVSAKVVLLW